MHTTHKYKNRKILFFDQIIGKSCWHDCTFLTSDVYRYTKQICNIQHKSSMQKCVTYSSLRFFSRLSLVRKGIRYHYYHNIACVSLFSVIIISLLLLHQNRCTTRLMISIISISIILCECLDIVVKSICESSLCHIICKSMCIWDAEFCITLSIK